MEGSAIGIIGPDELLFDAGGAALERRSADGVLLANTVIPAELGATVSANASVVYTPNQHALFDLDAEVELPWDGKLPGFGGVGTLAGDSVVHVTCDGLRLVAVPY